MNPHIRQILELLKSGRPDQQLAAAIVLGELRPKENEAVKVLANVLGTAGRAVRLAAIEAMGRIGLPSGLPHLIPLLEIEDADVRGKALEAMSALGSRAVPALAKKITTSPPPVRRAIVTVLARIRDKRATDALISLIQSAHPEASKEASLALASHSQEMTKTERRAIRARVERMMRGSVKKVQPVTLSSGLALVGAFGDASSAPLILRLAGPGYPEPVRREALLALGAALRGTTLPGKVITAVFSLFTDKAPHSLTAAALEVLYRLELPASASSALLGLLDARDPAVRRFAARKLGNMGGARVTRRLVALLADPDQSLRDAVADSLSKLPESALLLLSELFRHSDVHKAWSVAHILNNHAAKIPKPQLRELIKKGIDLIRRGDRVWEPYLHIARHADPKLLYASLMAEAGRLKRARRYEDAESVLKPLARTDNFDAEARFELSLASLKASVNREDVSPRSPDSPLELFRTLARDPAFPFIKRIRKEKNHLDAEDLYWLGFHLAEGPGEEKLLGAELLRMVAQKEGKSKLGRNARNKLRLEGLGG